MGRPVIKVLTGVRRSGKSCLLKMLSQRVANQGKIRPYFVDMELADFFSLRVPGALDRYLQKPRSLKGKKALFIDEIQEIPEWERTVNGLLKTGDWDIYLTGSNARLLSSELATLIAGRYVEFPVYPLGYAEYLQFCGRGDNEVDWQDFLRYGGFPGLHELPATERVRLQYLMSLQDTIVLRDVVQRHAIREPKLLESVLDFVYDNVGAFTTAKSMSDYLKSQHVSLSVVALQGYLHAMESGYLLYQARRYDIKGKRLLEIQSKYYLADLGLRYARLGPRDRDIAGLLENIVYLELRRRGYTVHVGRLGELEVDFVAIRNGLPLYLQVATTMQDPQTRAREFRSLEAIPDNYPKILLSLDPVESVHNGIFQMPLKKFLLQKSLPWESAQ